MNWFDGIDTRLAQHERKQLADLERKRRGGAEVSPFPGFDTYSKLRARYGRRSDLQQFQKSGEALLFGELVVGGFFVEQADQLYVGGDASQPAQWLASLNLPARKRAYDKLKISWQRANPTDYNADLELHLADVVAEEAARITSIRNPDNYGGDSEKAAIHTGLVRRFFREYREYMQRDLLKPAIPTGPASPVASELSDTEAATPDHISQVVPALPLNPPAPATDRWAGLLINYTLTDLNNLLVFVGLLETAKPLVVADDKKPGQWVAVAAALKKAGRTKADKAPLHRAFLETYGEAVGSLRTFQGQHNEANEAAQKCYDRALSRLTS